MKDGMKSMMNDEQKKSILLEEPEPSSLCSTSAIFAAFSGAAGTGAFIFRVHHKAFIAYPSSLFLSVRTTLL